MAKALTAVNDEHTTKKKTLFNAANHTSIKYFDCPHPDKFAIVKILEKENGILSKPLLLAQDRGVIAVLDKFCNDKNLNCIETYKAL